MTTKPTGWDEDTSRTYLDLADVAVPGRPEQVEVLLSVVPASADEFTVVDVCCGDGTLSEALLDRFTGARVLALDGSDVMRDEARQRLARFGERADVREFALERASWGELIPDDVRCVVSSLALHHLDDAGKRDLFRALARRLEHGAALLIADIVAPASDIVRKSHRETWVRAAREQSLALTGSDSLYQRASDESWGYYDGVADDEIDTPSRLSDQLKWLEQAGFREVDCFWLRAGFAIYGGYR